MKDLPNLTMGERGSGFLQERARCRRLSLALLVVLLGTMSLVSCGGTGTNSSNSGSGQPQLSLSLSTINFGTVLIGNTTTQPITISNTGTASLTVSQVTISGSAFSMTGISAPLALAAGQSTVFTVAFTPQASGSVTGGLSLVSNAPPSPVAISLSGTGLATGSQVSASPTTLSFGNVALESSNTQTVMLTNPGNSSANISQISVSGAGFTTSGLAPPLTLASGQSTSMSVVFSPASYGGFSGSVSIVSSATNSPAIVSLSGSSHANTLTWDASTSAVVGYNVYRSTQSGGPYAKMNSSLLTSTTFTDVSVEAGQTLFYVVTAVDSKGIESNYSNETSSTIPSP